MVRLVADAASCADTYVAALEASPQSSLAYVYRLATYGTMIQRDAVAVRAWLATDTAAAHVIPEDRAIFSRNAAALYLTALLATGLTERGLAYYDTLAPATQVALLKGGNLDGNANNWPDESIVADGAPLVLDDIAWDPELRVLLSAALLSTGRRNEAVEMLRGDLRVSAAQAQFVCLIAIEPAEGCDFSSVDSALSALLVEHAIERPSNDPYRLAEALFGANRERPGTSGALADLCCAIFAEPQYGSVCEAGRAGVARQASSDASQYNFPASQAALAAIRQAGLPGFAAIETELANALDVAATRYGGPAKPYATRASVDPVHPLFAVSQLPARYAPPSENPAKDEGKGVAAIAAAGSEFTADLGPMNDVGEVNEVAKSVLSFASARSDWPEGLGEPPPGMLPLRWTADDNAVTMVAVSPIFDPAGEVSAGGYWIVLSEDGGANWREALYTGLAEHFPYVFLRDATIPLRDGDAINLPVDIALVWNGSDWDVQPISEWVT